MKIHVKILRSTYDLMRSDLLKPHPFAYERIGFLSAKTGNKSRKILLVLLTEYHTVSDHNYIEDENSGARINSTAIREVMQRILDTRNGAFHVHVHAHNGIPHLGKMDRTEIPPLIQSFRTVGSEASHGILLLSNNSCYCKVWAPNSTIPTDASKFSIIGYPLEIIED